MRRLAAGLNGISVAYIMALVNATFAVVAAFGVFLNSDQRVAISVLLNTALALAVHLSHRLGELQTQASEEA